MKDVNDINELLWNEIISREGQQYSTHRGKSFSYRVKRDKAGAAKGEITIGGVFGAITRATILLAGHRAMELQAEKGCVKNHRKLGVYGSEYLYPVFLDIGICSDAPGKMSEPFPAGREMAAEDAAEASTGMPEGNAAEPENSSPEGNAAEPENSSPEQNTAAAQTAAETETETAAQTAAETETETAAQTTVETETETAAQTTAETEATEGHRPKAAEQPAYKKECRHCGYIMEKEFLFCPMCGRKL